MNEKIYHHTKTFIYSRQAGLGATRRNPVRYWIFCRVTLSLTQPTNYAIFGGSGYNRLYSHSPKNLCFWVKHL